MPLVWGSFGRLVKRLMQRPIDRILEFSSWQLLFRGLLLVSSLAVVPLVDHVGCPFVLGSIAVGLRSGCGLNSRSWFCMQSIITSGERYFISLDFYLGVWHRAG